MSRGIQPRLSAKVPKDRLSGKGCGFTKTTRMLAQRQPSFKECVTAHWSSDFAPKMNGAQAYYRSCRCHDASCDVVGEHTLTVEGVP